MEWAWAGGCWPRWGVVPANSSAEAVDGFDGFDSPNSSANDTFIASPLPSPSASVLAWPVFGTGSRSASPTIVAPPLPTPPTIPAVPTIRP